MSLTYIMREFSGCTEDVGGLWTASAALER